MIKTIPRGLTSGVPSSEELEGRAMSTDSSTVVAKVATVLRCVADYGHVGARLVDIARESEIARPTVHRLLQDLVAEGLVTQRSDRAYQLGPAAFSLGLSAPLPIGDVERINAVTRDLADFTTVTCYVGVLLRRRVLYVSRAQGSSPIHIYSVEVGETRPLTTTHAGIALLSTLSAPEQDAVLSASALEVTRKQYSIPLALDSASIRQMMTEVNDRGYLYGRNLTSPGVAGMAALVPMATGKPFVAVTIAAVNDHLDPKTARRFAPRLLAAAASLSEIIGTAP
ncbi:IclR family transcriptional regulator [Microbacterium sp. C23T]